MHGVSKLDASVAKGQSVEMENFFSRLALDIIGKAVFNYNFDSLTHDDPLIKAVYTVLREAEHRSIAAIPYWDIPGVAYVLPNQRRVVDALQIINGSLDELIAKCKVARAPFYAPIHSANSAARDSPAPTSRAPDLAAFTPARPLGALPPRRGQLLLSALVWY